MSDTKFDQKAWLELLGQSREQNGETLAGAHHDPERLEQLDDGLVLGFT